MATAPHTSAHTVRPETAAKLAPASRLRAVDTRGGASQGTGDPRSPITYASTSALVSTAVARPAAPEMTRPLHAPVAAARGLMIPCTQLPSATPDPTSPELPAP